MVGADSSVSVIDQVVQFTAIFAIWIPHFRYHRSIRTLVFEQQEGRHFIDGISSWDLVIRHQPSLACLNEVSYQSLIWHVRCITNTIAWLCEHTILSVTNSLLPLTNGPCFCEHTMLSVTNSLLPLTNGPCSCEHTILSVTIMTCFHSRMVLVYMSTLCYQ